MDADLRKELIEWKETLKTHRWHLRLFIDFLREHYQEGSFNYDEEQIAKKVLSKYYHLVQIVFRDRLETGRDNYTRYNEYDIRESLPESRCHEIVYELEKLLQSSGNKKYTKSEILQFARDCAMNREKLGLTSCAQLHRKIKNEIGASKATQLKYGVHQVWNEIVGK